MQHGRFIIFFVGICVAGYAMLIGIGRSPLYCEFSRSYFDTAPCFKSGMTGITADILLVGDSSLLYGIRPDMIAEHGGGTAYNLGMVGPSFSYQVAQLIDGYLASNKRPRAIVLYFSPWETITRDRLTDPQWAPLGIYLLRHGSWRDIARFLTIRPSALVEMPPLILTGLTLSGPRLDDFAAQMQASGGYLAYQATDRTLAPDCQPNSLQPPTHSLSDNRAALAALRRRYQARGITLFVYVAPIAVCDNQIDRVRQEYQGISDNIPEALPNVDFADDSLRAMHVHASSAGVAAFTDRLVKFLGETVRPRLAAHS